MSSKEYDVFVSSFNERNELVVTQEEFQQRSEQLNKWLLSLEEEKRIQIAKKVEELIIRAQKCIVDKQSVFEEMILINDGRMKANSHYGKY
ncbi:flagellar biosynthesis protein FlgG [Bacillus manliponensis]|uniref:flagellar biosynthesis protein FlgG n=1 Tax=Bacillus manliponensis TaxID=574376 RepID=UPI003513D76F